MIEILLEDILHKIHQKNFSDPKQVSEELGRLIIRDNLTQDQFAYCSSKIFNSDLNLFSFLHENYLEKDKHITNLRKEVLSIVCDYLQVARGYLINYLRFIRDSALTIFKKDISQLVKETALKIVVKILQNYDSNILEPIVQVESLATMLLDEIKMLKPSPSIKGKIWQILGELVKRFPNKMQPYILEIMEVSFYSIQGMMENTQKVEVKALKGLLQLTRCVLESGIRAYPTSELKALFQYAMAGSQKIDDIATYDVDLFNTDHARVPQYPAGELEKVRRLLRRSGTGHHRTATRTHQEQEQESERDSLRLSGIIRRDTFFQRGSGSA